VGFVDDDTDPLPEDPALAEVASAMRDATHWAAIVDAEWRVVYMTDGIREGAGLLIERARSLVGLHLFGPESLERQTGWRTGAVAVENMRSWLNLLGAWVLEDTPGGCDALEELVDPRLRDVVQHLVVTDETTARSSVHPALGVERVTQDVTGIRLRRADGTLAGTAIIEKPHISMTTLTWLGTEGDPRHFERMRTTSAAGRRPAAILFADLEGSSPLARKLSTANYFTLVRRMARAADRCVIDAGGITGRHAGDGVVAFFVAEHYASESAAAKACIETTRVLSARMEEIAVRSNLTSEDLTLRYGLHWGATLYIGSIVTSGRSEVTALGDEVNEAARIEACATGGRTLASKHLIERLDTHATEALGLDLDRIAYTQLRELTTATDKARRDAPAIPVCAI
jgi:class 3 adenylate cyclase